jgi:hypothetical protein
VSASFQASSIVMLPCSTADLHLSRLATVCVFQLLGVRGRADNTCAFAVQTLAFLNKPQLSLLVTAFSRWITYIQKRRAKVSQPPRIQENTQLFAPTRDHTILLATELLTLGFLMECYYHLNRDCSGWVRS